jgi:hypothetical protein
MKNDKIIYQKNFLKIVKEDLCDYGGKVLIQKGKYCGGKSKCSGLFYLNNDEVPIIKVAANNHIYSEESIGILVHEYCHFLQWRDEVTVWADFDKYGVCFDSIIAHPSKYKKELINLINLELDCEKKSVRMIKLNNLLDHKQYAKIANAILYKYVYLYHFNEWPEVAIEKSEVIKHCKTRFLKSAEEYLKIDKDIIKLCNKKSK